MMLRQLALALVLAVSPAPVAESVPTLEAPVQAGITVPADVQLDLPAIEVVAKAPPPQKTQTTPLADIRAEQEAKELVAHRREVLASYGNGQLPVDSLCALSWLPAGHRLECGAAAALEDLNASYRQTFGADLRITDTYRPLEVQQQCWDDPAKRFADGTRMCAPPGTSNHGTGTAIDAAGGIERFGTPEHEWVVSNAPRFGWEHPWWAKEGAEKPEPWHFEYVG